MTNSRGKEGWESRRAIRQGREVQNGPVQKKEVPEKSERKLREARNELERIQRSLPIEGGSAALVPEGEYEHYLDELARYKLRAEKIGEEFPEALSDAKAAQENSTRVMLEVGELMAAKKFSAPAEQSKPPTGLSSVPDRGGHLTKEELEALVAGMGAAAGAPEKSANQNRAERMVEKLLLDPYAQYLLTTREGDVSTLPNTLSGTNFELATVEILLGEVRKVYEDKDGLSAATADFYALEHRLLSREYLLREHAELVRSSASAGSRDADTSFAGHVPSAERETAQELDAPGELQNTREGTRPVVESTPIQADTSSVKPAMLTNEDIAAAIKRGKRMREDRERGVRKRAGVTGIPGNEPFVPSATGEEEIEKILSSGAENRRRAEENVAYSDRIAHLNFDIHEARKTGDMGRLAVLEDMKHALVQGEFVQREGARRVERGPEPEKEKKEGESRSVTAVASEEGAASGELPKPSIEERLQELVKRGDLRIEDLYRRFMKYDLVRNPESARLWLEDEAVKKKVSLPDKEFIREKVRRLEELRGGNLNERNRIYRELGEKIREVNKNAGLREDEVLRLYAKTHSKTIECRLGLLELRRERANYAAARSAAERVGSSWWPPENWLKKGDVVSAERAERTRQLEEAEQAYAAKKGEVVRENLQGRLREHERETKMLGDAAVERAKETLMERLRLGLSWLGEQNLYNRFSSSDREKLKWYEKYLYRSLSAKTAITYGLLGISAATGLAAVGAGTVVGLRAVSSLTGFFGTRMALRTLWEKFEFKELDRERIKEMKVEEVYEEFARRMVRARLGGKDTKGDPTVRRLRRMAAEGVREARRAVESSPETAIRAVVEKFNEEAEEVLQKIYDRRTKEAAESGRISAKEAVITGGAAGVAALLALGAPRWLVEKTGISDAVGSLVEKLREGLTGDEVSPAGMPPASETPNAGSGSSTAPEAVTPAPDHETGSAAGGEPKTSGGSEGVRGTESVGSEPPRVGSDRVPTPGPEAQTIPGPATPSVESQSPTVPGEASGSDTTHKGAPETDRRGLSSTELPEPERAPATAGRAVGEAGEAAGGVVKKNFDFDLGAIESGDSFEGKLIAGMKKSQELREALGVDGKLSGEELNRAIERRAHLVAIESGVADKGLNLDPETHVVVEGGKVRLEGAGGVYTIAQEAAPGNLKKAAEKATEALAKKAQDIEGLKMPPIEEWTKYLKPKEISEDAWRALMNWEDASEKRLESNIAWLAQTNLPDKERLLASAQAALDLVRERGFDGTNAGGPFVQERYNAIQSALAGESERIEALREPFRTAVAAADSIGEPMRYPSGVTDAGVSEAAKVVEAGTPPAIPKEIIKTFTPKAGLEKYPDLLSTTERARKVASELARLGKITPYANELKQSLETVWKQFNTSPSAATWKQVQGFIENYAKYIKDYGPKIEAGGK